MKNIINSSYPITLPSVQTLKGSLITIIEDYLKQERSNCLTHFMATGKHEAKAEEIVSNIFENAETNAQRNDSRWESAMSKTVRKYTSAIFSLIPKSNNYNDYGIERAYWLKMRIGENSSFNELIQFLKKFIVHPDTTSRLINIMQNKILELFGCNLPIINNYIKNEENLNYRMVDSFEDVKKSYLDYLLDHYKRNKKNIPDIKEFEESINSGSATLGKNELTSASTMPQSNNSSVSTTHEEEEEQEESSDDDSPSP